MPFDTVVEYAARPSQHVRCYGRRSTVNNTFQHVIDMARFHVLHLHAANAGVYIFVDTAAEYIGVLPAREDLTLKVFSGKL